MTTPLSIRCPECNAKLKVKSDKAIGKKLPCPKCKHAFVVQVPEPPPDEAFNALDELESLTSADLDEKIHNSPAIPTLAAHDLQGKTQGLKEMGWRVPAMIAGGGVLAICVIVGAVLLFTGNGTGTDGAINDDLVENNGRSRYDSDREISRLILGDINAQAPSPYDGNLSMDRSRAAASDTGTNGFNLAYLPEDSDYFVMGRVASIWNTPVAQQFLANDPQVDKLQQFAGFRFGDIDTVTMGTPTSSDVDDAVAVVRFSRAPDTEKLTAVASASQHEGQTYYLLPQISPLALYVPNEHTYVLGSETSVKEAIARGDHAQLRRDLEFVDTGWHLVVAHVPSDVSILREAGAKSLPPSVPPAVAGVVQSFTQDAEAGVFAMSVIRGFEFQLQGKCETADGATRLKLALEELRAYSKQQLADFGAQLAAQNGPGTSLQVTQTMQILKIGDQLLDQIQVEQTDDQIVVQAKLRMENPAGQADILTKLLLPAIQNAREAARRNAAQGLQ